MATQAKTQQTVVNNTQIESSRKRSTGTLNITDRQENLMASSCEFSLSPAGAQTHIPSKLSAFSMTAQI